MAGGPFGCLGRHVAGGPFGCRVAGESRTSEDGCHVAGGSGMTGGAHGWHKVTGPHEVISDNIYSSEFIT